MDDLDNLCGGGFSVLKMGDRSLAWTTWDNLCGSKTEGGLGFDKFHHSNLALLATRKTRLATSPKSGFCVSEHPQLDTVPNEIF